MAANEFIQKSVRKDTVPLINEASNLLSKKLGVKVGVADTIDKAVQTLLKELKNDEATD